MARINGEEREVSGMSLAEWLASEGYREGSVAVEYNGEILERDAYPGKIIHEGDVIEVVCFMGGG